MPIKLNGITIFDENNFKVSLPILYFTWSDYLFNNSSWLRADTFSWQDGSVYTSAYQHLVSDIAGKTSETETVSGITITFYRATDGHKICLANQAEYVSDLYDAIGVAWYYILDTANTRFKLPRMLPLGDTASVVGTGKSLGLTNGASTNGTAGLMQTTSTGGLVATTQSYDKSLPSAQTSGTSDQIFNQFDNIGVTTDPTKSGLAANLSHTSNDGAYKYLYFYVDNTVQGQTTIDVGQVMEDLNGKADLDLANVSATGKNASLTWAMPDYTAAIDLTRSSLPYTAPYSGIIIGTMAVDSGATGGRSLAIDGVTLVNIGADQRNMFTVVIEKGSILSAPTNSDFSLSAKFSPLKGAN
jgi:hypothetical protein